MGEPARAQIGVLRKELAAYLKASKLPDDMGELGTCAQELGGYAKRFQAFVGEFFGDVKRQDFATQAGNSRVNIATAVGRNIYTPKQAVVQEAKFYERYLLILEQQLGPPPRVAEED